MTIEEFAKYKKETEDKIEKLINDFNDKTPAYIKDIDISYPIFYRTSDGEFNIGECTVNLDIKIIDDCLDNYLKDINEYEDSNN